MDASVEAELRTFTFAPVIQPVKEILSSMEPSVDGAGFVSEEESLSEELPVSAAGSDGVTAFFRVVNVDHCALDCFLDLVKILFISDKPGDQKDFIARGNDILADLLIRIVCDCDIRQLFSVTIVL